MRGLLLDGRTSQADPERGPGRGLILPPDIAELVDIERQNWGKLNRGLKESGELLANKQGFRSLYPNGIDPPIVSATEVAAAEDKIMWDPAGTYTQTSIGAKTLYAGVILKLTAFGINTTAVTGAQTVAFTPRFGTTVSGTALGVSRTQPVVAEVLTTVPWKLEMWFQVRLIGSSGTAVCGGEITCRSLIGTAATTNTAPVNFGTTSASATTIDTTVASGLLVSVNASLSTNKWQTHAAFLETLN